MEYCGLCRSEVHPEAIICPSCHGAKEKAQSGTKTLVGLLLTTVWVVVLGFGWGLFGWFNIVLIVLGFMGIRYVMNHVFDEGYVWRKRV